MTHQEKITWATEAAENILDNNHTEKQVIEGLKEKGLYQRDIDNVLATMRNKMGDRLQPIIKEVIMNKGRFSDKPELAKLEPEVINRIAKQEITRISTEQKRKVTKLLKEGKTELEIIPEINLDFYPVENIQRQAAIHAEVKSRNGIGGRMMYIIGGIAMILIGGGITMASMNSSGGGRVFYGLIIVGFITLIKGFMTVDEYDYQ